jgi:hypothetical protein
VRLPAKLTLASVMVLPLPVAWPGGLPCPWTRGTVDTVACCKTTRDKRWSQRSRPCDQDCRAGSAQEPGWLVSACGWGSGMPAPSGQIPPPGARWENEAPVARAACGPSQAIGLVGLTVRLLLGESALGAPGIVLGFLQDVRDERIAKFLLRELIL